MTGYRKFLGLDDTDAAYIAGLIDGEGTVTLTRKHKKGPEPSSPKCFYSDPRYFQILGF
jgi:hypothetical protein